MLLIFLKECEMAAAGAQCNNSGGDSLVLAIWYVLANASTLRIVMTSLCMLMIRKVKNICLFNGYILFLNLVIFNFTLEKSQKVHKVSNSSAFPGVGRNL